MLMFFAGKTASATSASNTGHDRRMAAARLDKA
jgi:hypothetical protein